MVNMGSVRAGDLVRPDAIAQIAAALGAGDGNLHLGQASILARLELGQNRIAAMYRFLIGRHSAAVAGVERHNPGKVAGVLLFFPNCGERRNVRLVGRCYLNRNQRRGQHQAESATNSFLRVHVPLPP